MVGKSLLPTGGRSLKGCWDQANAQILQAKTNGESSVTIPALHPWTGPGGDKLKGSIICGRTLNTLVGEAMT